MVTDVVMLAEVMPAERLDAAQDLLVHRCHLRRSGAIAVGMLTRNVRISAGFLKARLDVAHRGEGANHQARRNEQDESQRDLRHHQRVARPMPLAAVARSAAAFLQRVAEIRIRILDDRDQSEQQAGRQRDAEREREHDRIDRDLFETRKLCRIEREEQLNAGVGEASPSTPPAMLIVNASDINSRITCDRFAPSAMRIASSCWRPSARTRNRLATFAQATSSTMPTVPSRIHSICRCRRPRLRSAAAPLRAELDVVKHLPAESGRQRRVPGSSGSAARCWRWHPRWPARASISRRPEAEIANERFLAVEAEAAAPPRGCSGGTEAFRQHAIIFAWPAVDHHLIGRWLRRCRPARGASSRG